MKRAEPGWFVLTLAGFAALLGSFMPFYTFAEGVDVTVWSRGLFPTAALIPLLGFVIGLQALFVLIVGHEPRSPFLNFSWEQVRLAVGAFMILLALSYLLQDRAGGSLGSGYLVVSLASLVTFAGGVMTRRAQLARGGEAAPARRRQLTLRPALSTVNRGGAAVARNVGAFGRSVARGFASLGRNVKARPRQPKEARGAITPEAKLDTAQPPPPLETFPELPADPGPPPPVETFPELPVEPVPEPTKPAAEEATADAPVDATEEKVAEEKVADEKVAEEKVAEEKVAEEKVAEEKVAEEPVEPPAPEPVEEIADVPTEEIATEPARLASLSAAPEAEPDVTVATDGDTPPPKRDSPDGSDKAAARKRKRKRQRRPAKKVEKEVEKNVQENVQEVETREPAGTGQEPQSPAAPG